MQDIRMVSRMTLAAGTWEAGTLEAGTWEAVVSSRLHAVVRQYSVSIPCNHFCFVTVFYFARLFAD